MKTDRELLETAAKAATLGTPIAYDKHAGVCFEWGDGFWNPLTDDGDALRLAVRLRMNVETWIHSDSEWARVSCQEALVDEPHGNDPGRATRRAIVRAAAVMAWEPTQ